MKIAQRPRQARAILLGSIAALFLAAPFAGAANYTYTSAVSNTPGSPTEWSTGTGWNAVPLSNAATKLIFGNGTALTTGQTLFTDNDLSPGGVFQLNALNFTYAGSNSGTPPVLTITGNALEFVNNGATAPTISLTPTGTIKPVLVLNNDLQLTNSVAVTVGTDAAFDGAISGTGGLSFSGAGTVAIDNTNNTFTGGLTVGSGTTIRYYTNSSLGDASNVITLAGGMLATNVGYNDRAVNMTAASTIFTHAAPSLGGTTNWMSTLTGSGSLTCGILTKTGRTSLNFFGNATGFTGNLAANGNTSFTVGAAAQFGGPGAIFSGMTAANTITVSNGAIFTVTDGGSTTYVADRFGTAGNRPSVTLSTGKFAWFSVGTGTQTETLGALNVQAGASNVTAPSQAGLTSLLTFSILNRAVGADITFAGTGIYFTTAPALVGGGGSAGTATVSILPGAHTTTDFVTYGASGVRALTAAEYVSYTNNDFSSATSTNNAKVTSATSATMTSASAINSLLIAMASQTLTFNGGLTVVSGQIMTTGTGSATLSGNIGVSGNSLNVTTVGGLLTATNWALGDNGSPISLVKNGAGTIQTSGNATYSGGTYLNEGMISAGGSGHALGNGPVFIGTAGTLSINGSGFSAVSGYAGSRTSPTYTVQGSGLLNLSSAALSNEFFKISSESTLTVITTAAAQSLDLQTNLIAAPGAILAESTNAAGGVLAIKSGGVPIATAITTPTYYYGNPQQAITVGAGTPWLGVSSGGRGGPSQALSVTANSDFALLGASLMVGGFVPNSSVFNLTSTSIATPNGNVNVNIQNVVSISSATNTFGTAGHTVTFVIQPGGELQALLDNSLGSSGTPANVVVQPGGHFRVSGLGSVPSAVVNGNVLLQPGGAITFTNAPVGSGVITHTNGSIVYLFGSNTNIVSDATQDFGTVPGTIVRINAAGLLPGPSFGGVTKFDASFDDAAIYQWILFNASFGSASLPTDSLFTLSANNGVGGILTGYVGGITQITATTGVIRIGSGGGTFAAPTGQTFLVGQNFDLGTNTLKIGTPLVIDGSPRLGIVSLTVPSASPSTGALGSVISVTSGATLKWGLPSAAQIPDATRLNVAAGATADLAGVTDTIESLTGGGTVTSSVPNGTLILAPVTTDADFSGSISGSPGVLTKVTKRGSGTQTLSGTSSSGGDVVVEDGTLKVNGSLSGHVYVNGGTLSGRGVIANAIDVNTGGAISPGDGIGTLSTTGALSIADATSTFQLELKIGSAPQADLLNVAGGVTLFDGVLNVSLLNFDASQLSQTFLFVNNSSANPVNGAFSSITGLPAGVTATIDYAFSGVDSLGRVGDGNDIALILAIPEPTSAALLLAGLPLLALRRRRTKNRAARRVSP
jgi:autotransporter-associated beta strand protein